MSKFIQLLKRINISPSDFFELVGNINVEQPKYVEEVSNYYLTNDISSLYRLFLRHISLYHRDSKINELVKAAIAANFYYDLSGKNPMDEVDIADLFNFFSQINKWNYRDLMNFGNTCLLFPPEKVYAISSIFILSFSKITQNSVELASYFVNTILNIFLILIRTDTKLAQKLDKNIDSIWNDRFSSDSLIRKNYFEALLEFRVTGNNKSVFKLLDGLKKLGLNQLYEDLFQEYEKLN